MAIPAPLDAEQEAIWRSLMRIVTRLPRALDNDLTRATGFSLTEYTVLMNLSEATDRQLRMTELATATALSASRITRVVEALQADGLVTKERSGDDGRGNIATLTTDGLKRLKSAYPSHLASARRRVVDHLDAKHTKQLARLLTSIAYELDADPRPGADSWH